MPSKSAEKKKLTPAMEHQLHLEHLYSKNQLLPRIRLEFMDCELPFAKYFKEKEIPEDFGFDLLVQMALHKRANLATLVGLLRHHFPDAQTTADHLLKAAEADLVDWSRALDIFIVRYTISDDVQRELDKFQYPLPMVIPPMRVTNNKETGYLCSSGSILLKDNFHTDDVCLDHINRVNGIKFSVDLDTATMIKNSWRNLDKPKAGESGEDFEKRKKAFEKYDRTAKEVIDLLIQEGNEFYLTHRYDKRGRVYCQGYHVNYQGAAWNKAVIQLADKEMVE